MGRMKSGNAATGGEGNLAKIRNSQMVAPGPRPGLHDRRTRAPPSPGPTRSPMVELQELTLFSPAPSIYGGTDQVQRNIIGERVLGLPKEPGPSKDTPFRDLLKN